MWVCKKCGEQNSDSSRFCLGCGEKPSNEQVKKAIANQNMNAESAAARIQREAAEKKAREERERQERANLDAFLKSNGHEGYYEYKVITVNDTKGGGTNVYALSAELNELGRMGWHLRSAYTNELGVNSTSVGGFGVNSTMDQHVLILERFIKFKDEIQGE